MQWVGLGRADRAKPPFSVDTLQVSLTARYAAFASEFINSTVAKGVPFFVYIAWGHMHVPIVYSEPYRGKSGKGLLGDALMEVWCTGGVMCSTIE